MGFYLVTHQTHAPPAPSAAPTLISLAALLMLGPSVLGMKMVQIFFYRIRDRICLEGFGFVRIRIRIFNIRYLSVSEYLNCIFIILTSNYILFNIIINIIRIRIRI